MSIQWGQRYSKGLPHSSDSECPECERTHNSRLNGEFTNSVVGIDDQGPLKSDRGEVVAVVIIECPKDGTKFWRHATLKEIKGYKETNPERFKELKLPTVTNEIKLR